MNSPLQTPIPLFKGISATHCNGGSHVPENPPGPPQLSSFILAHVLQHLWKVVRIELQIYLFSPEKTLTCMDPKGHILYQGSLLMWWSRIPLDYSNTSIHLQHVQMPPLLLTSYNKCKSNKFFETVLVFCLLGTFSKNVRSGLVVFVCLSCPSMYIMYSYICIYFV